MSKAVANAQLTMSNSLDHHTMFYLSNSHEVCGRAIDAKELGYDFGMELVAKLNAAVDPILKAESDKLMSEVRLYVNQGDTADPREFLKLHGSRYLTQDANGRVDVWSEPPMYNSKLCTWQPQGRDHATQIYPSLDGKPVTLRWPSDDNSTHIVCKGS